MDIFTTLIRELFDGIIYKRVVVGKNGKLFVMYKFRTMEKQAHEKEWQVRFHPVAKPRNDPRVTRIGRVLRRTGLDELPQIVNILKGDMGIVGYRPLTPDELQLLPNDLKDYRYRYLPGAINSFYARHNIIYDRDGRLRAEREYFMGLSSKNPYLVNIRYFFVILYNFVKGGGSR